jgi:hypothetical protein
MSQGYFTDDAVLRRVHRERWLAHDRPDARRRGKGSLGATSRRCPFEPGTARLRRHSRLMCARPAFDRGRVRSGPLTGEG